LEINAVQMIKNSVFEQQYLPRPLNLHTGSFLRQYIRILPKAISRLRNN